MLALLEYRGNHHRGGDSELTEGIAAESIFSCGRDSFGSFVQAVNKMVWAECIVSPEGASDLRVLHGL